MNPALILAAIEGAIALVEKLAPLIQQLVNKGEISVEQQAALQSRIAALSEPGLFDGPEWKV